MTKYVVSLCCLGSKNVALELGLEGSSVMLEMLLSESGLWKGRAPAL